ncbi:molybdopterin-dependent oxidoreductase [Ferrimicrobium sp.]|uniref:molybdopterin-dependent oxidoreductase n=1 Tax=Ferrimicrobium sp. TaxID=2926050 RepID=UPI00260381F1|nr:molybdopterin-dependent oxidoreductase [Ferrimicrobium sp.]
MESPRSDETGRRVGRRVFLSVLGAGVVTTLFGHDIAQTISGLANSGGFALGGFEIYTVTGSIPAIKTTTYRLKIDGRVAQPVELSYGDLRSMVQRDVTFTFTCVTGWTVPNTRWRGVRLADLIDQVRPHPEVHGLEFYSADGVYTDSLSLEEARQSNVLLAMDLDGKPISADHGAPVRLLVPSMYGYKSVKWLDRISFVPQQVPGYWEQRGYPVNATIS